MNEKIVYEEREKKAGSGALALILIILLLLASVAAIILGAVLSSEENQSNTLGAHFIRQIQRYSEKRRLLLGESFLHRGKPHCYHGTDHRTQRDDYIGKQKNIHESHHPEQ